MKKKILIVEDDHSISQLETILLKVRGYDVITESNGQAALESLKLQKPDLVLLDVMLPGMDGFEICQRIKSTPATEDIPVLFLTAKKTEKDIEKGLEVGADSYITKPFKSAELLRSIASCLNQGLSS